MELKYMRSKRVEYWNKVRKEVLKPMFLAKGITSCELRLKDCLGSMFLSFAHKQARRFYYDNPARLGAFEECLLSCVNCHKTLDASKELKIKTFKRLRGGE